MRADGNLSPQERTRLNTMQNRGSQDINRMRHNGVQPGATVQPRPTRPGQPGAELHSASPATGNGATASRSPARTNGGRPTRLEGSAP